VAYEFCKRKLWLSRRARIESGERDWDSPAKLHLLRLIFNRINSRVKVQSRTTFMLEAINIAPQEIIGTEISLRRGKLSGRIDVLRKTEDGFIIQEEKTSDPPKDDGVWPGEQIQVDAYAFLAEVYNKYSPVKGGIIICRLTIPQCNAEVSFLPYFGVLELLSSKVSLMCDLELLFLGLTSCISYTQTSDLQSLQPLDLKESVWRIIRHALIRALCQLLLPFSYALAFSSGFHD